jgi:hypothetical protein
VSSPGAGTSEVVARIALLCPDLLFGSRVEGALRAAGHEVERVDSAAEGSQAALLVIDLTADTEQRLEGVGAKGLPPALAFYSHVEQDVRRLAEQAGVSKVVPRSRMAREGAALVEAMLP